MDVSYFVPGLDVGTLGLDVATHLGERADAHLFGDVREHVGADLADHLATVGLVTLVGFGLLLEALAAVTT